MTVLKCKMCGGDLSVNDDSGIAVCEYCGTRQTLPKTDNEKKLLLYDRANHFRRNNEFDKASAIYEQVLGEDANDAEAYWSLVLCKYGIEYVEDPVSHKRVPTVNRAQYTSIFSDPDYKKAIELASIDQKLIYEEEAKAIDDIQKGILEISSKEEPFDVFICYKETDNNGRRTVDSVLAQDLYKELTNEGYKVFFSRITLEDKLGTAYEPYIFAALNSAKVMIAVGTSKENFNAVWVRNEWSRYLSLIKKGGKKTLIPAYRDMDPYDLPEEFSYLQAQDMSKLGFMQDLVRGVDKLLGKGTASKTSSATSDNVDRANVESLLKRAKLFLDNGDFKSTGEYCDKVLDIVPENADAHLTKMLSELKIKSIPEIDTLEIPLSSTSSYKNVLRFSAKDLKEYLEKKNAEIEKSYQEKKNKETRSRKKKTAIAVFALSCVVIIAGYLLATLVIIPNNKYKEANALLSSHEYEKAKSIYTELGDFKDSVTLIKECNYRIAINHYDDGLYESAFGEFKALDGYSDSKKYMDECNKSYIEKKTKNISFKPDLSYYGKELLDFISINSMTYSWDGSDIVFNYDLYVKKKVKMSYFNPPNGDVFSDWFELKTGDNKYSVRLSIDEIIAADYCVENQTCFLQL